MQKPVIVILGVLFFVLVYATFHIEQKVQDLRSELKTLNKEIIDDTQATHVLRAEWTYLNHPQRLSTIAEKYLAMESVKTAQYVNPQDVAIQPVSVVQANIPDVTFAIPDIENDDVNQ